MTLTDIRPSDDGKSSLDSEAKLRLELQHSAEWRHTLRDGRKIDVEIISHTLAYQGRKAAFVIVQEITERKEKQKLILDSEIRHRSLFENMQEGFAYCRMIFENDQPVDFEYLEVNQAFENITGLKNAVGKRVTEAIPGIRESNPELFEAYGRIARTGKPEKYEVYIKSLNTWFSASLYSIQQGYFASVFSDITKQKEGEEQLSKSERRFHQLFDDAPVGYHEIDRQGRIVEVNRTELEMLGFSANDMLGRPPWEFIVEREISRKAIDAKLVGAILSEHTYERTFRRKNGTTVNALISDRALRNEAGEIVGIRSTVQDISGRKQSEEALRSSEERLKLALAATLTGVWEWDVRTNDVFWSQECYRIVGMDSSTEKTLQGFQKLVHPDDLDLFNGAVQRSLSHKTPFAIEFRTITPRGEVLWLSNMGSTEYDAGGNPIRIIGTINDITQRKKAEQELRLLAQTLASAQDCISITDLENRFLFVNDAFRDTYGYTTGDLLGKDVSVLRTVNTPAATTDQILHGTQGGGWHGEILNRRKDGSEFPVELWTSVVKDEAGNPVAMVGVARNITTRKAAEEDIRQSGEQFRLIAENVEDMIAVLDLDGRRIYNSPSYKGILGDPESLRGTDGFQEVHPEDLERVKRVFRDTVRTGFGQRIEYRLMRPDGTERTIDSKGSVMRDGDGKVSRVVVVSRDVTEEKRLAAQSLRSQRMESIGTLAGGLAHDLNNVLAPIMMAIEVLRRKIPEKDGQSILNTLETSAKRGADIVRQVLAFGRGVKGERILVQLRHVAIELAKIAGETFPKSIDIRTNMPRNLWTVLADPTQMHQVLLNMLVNARDAMPRGGTLTLSAENIVLDEQYSRTHLDAKPGAHVCVVITDTGTGIPAAIREKIFEPFFTTKEIGMGTGLGLSTTSAIVRSHGGFITLESEVGKGTAFRIYIPATGAISGVEAGSEEAELPAGNGELVLVIDDEAAIREITKETLQAYGYTVMTAGDGAEGVALFANNQENIKVVITDIMMPVMDGTAAILALKKIKPDVKIIAASGLGSKGHFTPPPKSSIQGFLSKPYTAEKVLNVLAAALKS
jgi:PAS domain S-box-containing protein